MKSRQTTLHGHTILENPSRSFARKLTSLLRAFPFRPINFAPETERHLSTQNGSIRHRSKSAKESTTPARSSGGTLQSRAHTLRTAMPFRFFGERLYLNFLPLSLCIVSGWGWGSTPPGGWRCTRFGSLSPVCASLHSTTICTAVERVPLESIVCRRSSHLQL